jgi:hypothetical protein
MAVTSARSIVLQSSGDFVAANTYAAANNTASPCKVEIVTLASGANTVVLPSGGTTSKAVTIVMPSSNSTVTITLKGVTGDTGVVLHKTDPTSIALNSPITTFVLTASAELVGVTLIWS